MKKCSICEQEFCDEDFPWADKKSGRRFKFCKTCKKKKYDDSRKANPERFKEYSRRANQKARQDPNKIEQVREYSRRYYRRHKEDVNKRTSAYQKLHREEAKKWQRKWRDGHQEEIREARKKWYRTDKFKEYNKAWKESHLEEVRKTQRESKRRWRREHPDEARQYDREYRRRENAKLTDRAGAETKRARKKNAQGKFTREDIKQQLSKQNGRCYWCQEILDENFHVDHFIPLSRGGSNEPENIVISCPTCNIGRNNKMPDESIEYFRKNGKVPK